MSSTSPDAAHVIGPLVREHRFRWTYALAVVAAGGIFAVVGVVGLARFVANVIKDPSGETVLLGALVTLPFLLAATVLLVWGASRFRRVVALHQGGFYYKDGKGEWTIPWEAVEGVYHKIVRVYRADVEVDVQDVYTIALRDGTRLEVDFHFADIEEFGDAVTSTVTHMLLPWYRQAFHAGQPLDFGVVGIDRHGVHEGGKFLPWQEVESLSWKRGILSSDRAFLQIRRAGGLLAWAKLPVEQVKNYQVLMALAAELGKAE